MKIRKRLMSIALAMLIVLILPFTAVPSQAAEPIGYWTDEGVISGPPPYDASTKTYTISTAAQLAWLAKEINTIGSPYSGYIFKLGADIDLSGHYWVPIGTFTPTQKYFSYTFDGNGKTISNMTIGTETSPSTIGEIGLFGYVNRATIKDVNLTNISVYADLGIERITAGGLIGMGFGSTISGVNVSGVVNASSTSAYSGIGGIAGVVSSAGMSPNYIFTTIENCSSSVRIIARGLYISAGGLIGNIKDSYITNCYSTNDVSGEGAKYAGGLIGFAGNSGKITDSYALGDVQGSSDTDGGGLIGHSYFDVESCFALGNVTHSFVGGGLIGYGRMGNIENSFAVGNVTGSGPVGGLVGFSNSNGINSISNSFASGNIETKQTMPINQYAGGLVSYLNPAAGSVITNAYWNSDADQTVNLVKRDSTTKVGIDRASDASTAKSLDEMTNTSFAMLLNENRGEARAWNSVSSLNEGLPYLEGLYYVTPTYTVTFNSNGGSTVAPIADIANAAKVTLPAPPTKAGYIFAGWNTAEDGTGATFDGTSTITANLTVYAQWTAETYTVTFNSNGGSAVAPIADVEKAATVTLPAAPTKSGFVFAGWNTAEAGTGSIFDGDTYVTANITVYAQWTAQPELTSSVKHGIYVGGRITLTPNIDGGTWNWDEDFFTATFNSPATFTALKAGTTKITYSVEGGTVTYDVTIEAGILPATGQYFVNFFTGLGTLALATVILTGICKKRKKA